MRGAQPQRPDDGLYSISNERDPQSAWRPSTINSKLDDVQGAVAEPCCWNGYDVHCPLQYITWPLKVAMLNPSLAAPSVRALVPGPAWHSGNVLRLPVRGRYLWQGGCKPHAALQKPQWEGL